MPYRRLLRDNERDNWRSLVIITRAKSFGYLEHVERKRYRVNNVHSYHSWNEQLNDRIIEAAHRDGPMQRWQHSINRPAYKHS